MMAERWAKRRTSTVNCRTTIVFPTNSKNGRAKLSKSHKIFLRGKCTSSCFKNSYFLICVRIRIIFLKQGEVTSTERVWDDPVVVFFLIFASAFLESFQLVFGIRCKYLLFKPSSPSRSWVISRIGKCNTHLFSDYRLSSSISFLPQHPVSNCFSVALRPDF